MKSELMCQLLPALVIVAICGLPYFIVVMGWTSTIAEVLRAL